MSKKILESRIVNDNYTNFVYEKFDIQNKDSIITEVPLFDKDELNSVEWNILLVLGNSGSGKSTVLKTIGETQTPTYDYSKTVISQFDNLTPQEASDLLCSCGLSSVPIWLHKPNELSNGERARLDICWHINQVFKGTTGVIVIDEFTSVVNRDVAKSLSFALQRLLRKYNMKAIIASCHFDLIEWLQPDLIFNLNKQDKDGEAELEQFIYADDEEYVAYNTINLKDVLSDEKDIC